jgi:hypothetical protein
VSDRRAQAEKALARLGLDVAAIVAGSTPAAELVPRLTTPDAAELVAALGELAEPTVATLLVALEPEAPTREVRKHIRRALHRLHQRGIPLPEAPRVPAAPHRALAPAAEGFLSAFDAVGDRVVWIASTLPTGGLLLVDAVANEPQGLRQIHVGEVSRKQLRTVRERLEAETRLRLVAADWQAVDALLVEAHERTGASDRERDYLRVRARLTLLEEIELAGWVPAPESVTPFVAEIQAVRESPLVVSRAAQEERVREVLRRAATVLFPPAVLARRLRGTAYVLAETGRAPAARQALAVAQLLETRPADGLEVPFVALLVERGIGTLLAASAAREEEARKSTLVVTPGQFLKDRSSSRPGRTRG